LTQSLCPTLLAILNDNSSLTVEQLRNLRELRDELTLNTEANPSTAEQDEHSLIEGLRVIYG
jgi:hypothetical protein